MEEFIRVMHTAENFSQIYSGNIEAQKLQSDIELDIIKTTNNPNVLY